MEEKDEGGSDPDALDVGTRSQCDIYALKEGAP